VAVSLQVKHGKDHLPGKSAKLRHSLRCLSWFALNKAKLEKSQAEFWVFVLHGFDSRDPDFVVIPTTELKRRMTKVHHSGSGALHIYLCSTKNTRCWETRELRTKVMLQIAEGTYENPVLEFTQYLNEKGWAALTKKLTA